MSYWEEKAKRQREEIPTIAPRVLRLNLSDADVERISLFAAKGGLTVSQLLENFIWDLVDGTYSNGSDERMCAEQWYERCWFTHMADSNIAMLAKHDVLDYMAEKCDEYDEAIQDIEDIKRYLQDCDDVTEEDLHNAEEFASDIRSEMDQMMWDAGCKGSFEEVTKDVKEWAAAMHHFKNS